MHSPLSNCFLRPRSSSAHQRNSSSSSSSSLSPPCSPLPAANNFSVSPPSFYSSPSFFLPASSSSPLPSPPPCSSPFPSPFALNVPLGRSSYHCIVTSPSPSSSLALSGELLYTGLPTGDISVSRHHSLLECARFGIGDGVVKSLLVTDDRVFTAHRDHKIRVWRRPDACRHKYRLLATLPTTKDYVRNVLAGKDYMHIRRHHKRLWIQHVDTITSLAVGQDGSLLYSASWDKTVRVWQLRNMRCIQAIKAHDDAINAIVVGSDGLLYTASADRTIKVWRKLGQHVLVATLQGHKAAVNALAIRADGRCLYSGGSDCQINVWEKEEGSNFLTKLTMSLRGHRHAILCVAVSGPLLCSGSSDKTVRIWRRGSLGLHLCLAVLHGHTAPVKCVSLFVNSFRSCFVHSASLDHTTKVWSVVFDKEDEFTSTGRTPNLPTHAESVDVQTVQGRS